MQLAGVRRLEALDDAEGDMSPKRDGARTTISGNFSQLRGIESIGIIDREGSLDEWSGFAGDSHRRSDRNQFAAIIMFELKTCGAITQHKMQGSRGRSLAARVPAASHHQIGGAQSDMGWASADEFDQPAIIAVEPRRR